MSIRARIVACWACLAVGITGAFVVSLSPVLGRILGMLYFVFPVMRIFIPCASRAFKRVAIYAIVAWPVFGVLSILLVPAFVPKGGVLGTIAAGLIMAAGFAGILAFFGSLLWSDILVFRRQKVLA